MDCLAVNVYPDLSMTCPKYLHVEVYQASRQDMTIAARACLLVATWLAQERCGAEGILSIILQDRGAALLRYLIGREVSPNKVLGVRSVAGKFARCLYTRRGTASSQRKLAPRPEMPDPAILSPYWLGRRTEFTPLAKPLDTIDAYTSPCCQHQSSR